MLQSVCNHAITLARRNAIDALTDLNGFGYRVDRNHRPRPIVLGGSDGRRCAEYIDDHNHAIRHIIQIQQGRRQTGM